MSDRNDSIERQAGRLARTEGKRVSELKKSHRISRQALMVGIAAFLAIVSGIQFWRNGFIGPDTFLLFILLSVVVMGQARTFLRDWIPFVVVFFGWQMLRGYADQAAKGGGFPVHERDLVAAEQWLFGGHIPTVVLQKALYKPGVVHWYDIMATAFWAFHFVLPLLFAYLLWMRNRPLYWRFAYALIVLSFAGFLTYVLFPAVPPWLAPRHKLILDEGIPFRIHLIREATIREIRAGGGVASWIMRNGNPNPIAAMPSLHAAYPTLVFLFSLFHWRRLSPIALLYCFGLWFSIVYIGDHYVIDALAGVLYAIAAFFSLEALYRYMARRRTSHAQQAYATEAAP